MNYIANIDQQLKDGHITALSIGETVIKESRDGNIAYIVAGNDDHKVKQAADVVFAVNYALDNLPTSATIDEIMAKTKEGLESSWRENGGTYSRDLFVK